MRLARALGPPSRWLAPALVVVLVAVYLVLYLDHWARPGRRPDWPQGWFSWNDQGWYLKSALALRHLDFALDNHHYPFGYPALALPFLDLMPGHPWLVANLAATVITLLLAFAIYTAFVSRMEAALLLLATFVLQRTLLEEMVIPWNTIPTQACFYAAALLLLRGHGGPGAGTIVGLLAGITFVCRPAETLFLLPLLLAFVLRPQGARERARFVLGMALAGAVLPAVLAAMNLRIFGAVVSPYVDSVRAVGFSTSALGVKLQSIFFGAGPLYNLDTPMLVQRFPWLLLAPSGVVAWLLVERRHRAWVVATAASVLGAFLFYGAYNHFDAVTIFQYHLVHYVTWTVPLLTLFAYLALRCAPRLARRLLFLLIALAPLALVTSQAVGLSPRGAVLVARADALSRVEGRAPSHAELTLPVAIKGCANVLDVVGDGLTSLPLGSFFLVDGNRTRRESLHLHRTKLPVGERLILHRPTCTPTLSVIVRNAVPADSPITIHAYKTRLRWRKWW